MKFRENAHYKNLYRKNPLKQLYLISCIEDAIGKGKEHIMMVLQDEKWEKFQYAF